MALELGVPAKSYISWEEFTLPQAILLSALYPAGVEEPLTAFRPVFVPSVMSQIEYHVGTPETG